MANSVTEMAGDAPPAQPAPAKRAGRRLSPDVLGWLQAAPLSVVMIGFLLAPIVMIVIVSFWGATEFSIYPAFQFDNYEFLLTSPVTYSVFLNTIKYAVITWAITLVLGFTIAYFLAFHIRTITMQIVLFLGRRLHRRDGFEVQSIGRMVHRQRPGRSNTLGKIKRLGSGHRQLPQRTAHADRSDMRNEEIRRGPLGKECVDRRGKISVSGPIDAAGLAACLDVEPIAVAKAEYVGNRRIQRMYGGDRGDGDAGARGCETAALAVSQRARGKSLFRQRRGVVVGMPAKQAAHLLLAEVPTP